MMRSAVFLLFLSLLPAGGARAQLSGSAVLVLDSARQVRATFSTNERIVFQQKVANGSASASKIQFTFLVLDPTLKTVFTHTGNAVPGQVGNAASQIAGVQVSSFYTTPGVYRLTARAILDSQVVEQEATFTVSSPNIILIYPPNGARSVADKPLTLRWSSSGAARYRVTVGDNPSFYNAVFLQETAGAETALAYPDNPSDQRARLAAGSVYYWKVEGLDANSNAVAASAVPFNFTVESAALTRDIAVSGLEILGRGGDDITFRVTVENRGGTSESNLSLKFSVGGLPVKGSPVVMPLLSPAVVKQYTFTGTQPSDQGQSLAVACVEFFDDNAANNCKTLQLTRTQKEEDGGSLFDARKLTDDELWGAIRELLKERGIDLSDYSIVGADRQLTRAELEALLSALRSGQADVTVTGPTEEALPDYIAPPVSVGSSEAPAAPASLPPTEEPVVQADSDIGKEWAGLAPSLSEEETPLEITGARQWKRVWKRLGGKEPPEIDFKKNMIVGVVAGAGQRADRLEILEVQKRLKGLHVVFKLVVHRRLLAPMGPEQARSRSLVPYHLRVIPKSGMKIFFEKREK